MGATRMFLHNLMASASERGVELAISALGEAGDITRSLGEITQGLERRRKELGLHLFNLRNYLRGVHMLMLMRHVPEDEADSFRGELVARMFGVRVH